MYQVTVNQSFDAAHYLRGYGGKCENMHGHRFKVAVTVETDKLGEVGLAFDFVELKKLLKEVLDRFDHKLLNEVAPFDTLNPSSENIAVTIYKNLFSNLSDFPVRLASVQVWESPDSCITFRPDGV